MSAPGTDTSPTAEARPWLPGTGRQLLFALWFLALVYLLLQCVFPMGPWYANCQYQLGLERSWAVALVTLWIGVAIAAGRSRTARMRLTVLGLSLLLGAGVKWTLDEDRRLRSALLRADHLVIRMFFIGNREWTDRTLTTIDDEEAIRHMAETLRFDQDPPWRVVNYFTIHGDITVEIVDRDGEVITDFIVINQGEAIRWRPVMSTDRHTPQRFQEALVSAVLQSIPEDGGLSLPDRNSGDLSFLLAWCGTPEAIRRIAAKIPHLNAGERQGMAHCLAMWEQPANAADPLTELAQDPAAEVRREAIWALDRFDHLAEVRAFLIGYDIDAEPDPDVVNAVLMVRGNLQHEEAQN
jgi:hypothetical protein